ncbi:hypothetical protein GFK91_29790 (plasmid) [Roseibium aggregatum]|uniref:hypothetical protein n=1 Tax=Roseibium aggregatum TaxID=187304 RepID=UPI001E50FDB4|nr:hypothetical protein [Roseibium aggregatum]MEC9470032.1 hypothetical protein [Pseudomonadota bacterium]UES59939.1 hypothetical protein GFK91_29790 [Roseibium aggregatum]
MLKPKTIPSVDANAADHWPSVSRKAKLNNAFRVAAERFDNIRVGRIYEAWVGEISSMVHTVTILCQILAADDYREFRKLAAARIGIPELCSNDEIIQTGAFDAIQEAHGSLYGGLRG